MPHICVKMLFSFHLSKYEKLFPERQSGGFERYYVTELPLSNFRSPSWRERDL